MLPKAFQIKKLKKLAITIGNYLTQRCHRHWWVIFESKYPCKFEVICENSFRCDTGTQGKLFAGKTRCQNLMKLSLSYISVLGSCESELNCRSRNSCFSSPVCSNSHPVFEVIIFCVDLTRQTGLLPHKTTFNMRYCRINRDLAYTHYERWKLSVQ